MRHFRHRLHTWPGTILSAILCVVFILSLRAQEPVRSATAAPAIASFRRSPEAFFYLGPFQEELRGSVNTQYTDNVNLTATNKISDLSFSQALSLNTTWVISHLNQVTFNFGGAVIENFYGNGRNQVNFSIAPNSKLEFKLAVSDYRILLFDTFSYVQNPTTNPTATNTANLNSLSNTIGAVIDKDIGIALLGFSADYTYNNQSGTNVAGQANPSTTGNRETFRLGPRVTFRWSSSILYGFNVEATRSTGEHAASVNSLNFGPFINGKLSRDFEFDLAAGATLIDTKPSLPTGYYYSAAIRYRINRHWQLIFTGAHDLVFTTGTSLTEENVFQIETKLDLTRLISFTASSFVNVGDDKTAIVNTGATLGRYTQFGFSAGLGWNPRKRWNTTLTYEFVRREANSTSGTSSTGSQNYIQNTITFQIGYAF
ncbi:MAG: hypothetical protein JO334_06160 [Verrucomicrobia bacterium]|nr:hypothetical protein [Verrucomicrobiota bacterium]